MGVRVILFCLLVVACGQKSANISSELKKASEVQNQALKAYWEVSQDHDETACLELKAELDRIRNKMIDIPGVPHDHKYCNGKHHTSDIQLSDQEMLAIQQEWHDSIFARIKIYQDCIDGL
jgi:hypothetical protein